MAALEVYRTGSDRFPGETSLLTGIARIYEGIGNLSLSAKYYKLVLRVIYLLFNNISEMKLIFPPMNHTLSPNQIYYRKSQ